jgi:uncharacterized protein YhaN
MAANEYVQAAAAQLQSGATAIKTEIDQIRADNMNYERQATKDINDMEGEIRVTNARLASGQPDATDVALHARIQRLQAQLDAKKKEMADQKSKMNGTIRAKEAAMNDLMSQSRGLQNKAAGLK